MYHYYYNIHKYRLNMTMLTLYIHACILLVMKQTENLKENEMTTQARFSTKQQAQQYYNEQNHLGRTCSTPYFQSGYWFVTVL